MNESLAYVVGELRGRVVPRLVARGRDDRGEGVISAAMAVCVIRPLSAN
jgi:hypothetical protein